MTHVLGSICKLISHGKLDDLLSLLDTNEIVVQEVNVEARLQDARQYLCPAVEIIVVISIDPVENVEESVESQSCNVMRGNVLNESDLVEHHNLRDKCNGFKPQRVAPHELPSIPAAVYNQSGHKSCGEENFEVREVIAHWIVSLNTS